MVRHGVNRLRYQPGVVACRARRFRPSCRQVQPAAIDRGRTDFRESCAVPGSQCPAGRFHPSCRQVRPSAIDTGCTDVSESCAVPSGQYPAPCTHPPNATSPNPVCSSASAQPSQLKPGSPTPWPSPSRPNRVVAGRSITGRGVAKTIFFSQKRPVFSHAASRWLW